MPRIQFSDVTPPDKRRSIRNVPIPENSRRKTGTKHKGEISITKVEAEAPKIFEEKIKQENSEAYEYYYPEEKSISQSNNFLSRINKKHWLFGASTVILVLAFIFSMMTIFASASVEVKPKIQEIDVNVKANGTINKISEDSVVYEVVKLTESKTLAVPATGEEAVETKASGKIIIYNNFSTDPQRLIVRTRFESPEGLIFRIPESIVVPGKTIKNGNEVPGQIEVEVFADEAGEKYNIKKTDFTIPGFKNDANRYKNFYARSVTNMSGGFVGNRKTVSANDKQVALQSIDDNLRADLKKSLESKVPDTFVILQDAIVFKSKELEPKENGSSVSLGKEITAYALMLNKVDLSKKIVAEYVPKLTDWKNIKAKVEDFSSLKITNLPENLESAEKIDLEIAGKVKILADIDLELIKERLLGAPKEKASRIIDEFPGVSSITIAIRPIWKSSFPDNSSKIYVKTIINE